MYCLVPRIRVAKTALLVNCVFCHLPKQVLMKKGENDEFASYPRNPHQTPENDKNGGWHLSKRCSCTQLRLLHSAHHSAGTCRKLGKNCFFLYPVLVLGRHAVALLRCQTSAQYWIKIVHPWVQIFYPVLGLGSGRIIRGYFQTPILSWINFFLRSKLQQND